MAQLTAQQVKDLSKHFFSVAQSLTQFREEQWNKLTKEQHQQLSRLQWSVYNSTDDLLALSSVMALDEVQATLEQINQTTQRASDTITTTDNVNQVISIATQVIRLGGAVVSQSPLAIISALADLTNVT